MAGLSWVDMLAQSNPRRRYLPAIRTKTLRYFWGDESDDEGDIIRFVALPEYILIEDTEEIPFGMPDVIDDSGPIEEDESSAEDLPGMFFIKC